MISITGGICGSNTEPAAIVTQVWEGVCPNLESICGGQKKVLDLLGLVTGSCEPPDIGTETQALIHFKNGSLHSWPLSHLS